MPKKKSTQKTEAGYEIPVPKRGEVMAALKQAAKPSVGLKRSRRRRREKS